MSFSKKQTVILVVDDTLTNRIIMRTNLSKLDDSFLIMEAADGQEALLAIEQSGMPDLAIIDVMMPGMDGFELTRRIRGRATSWFPILMCSAAVAEEDIIRGISSGADDYITKPVNFQILKAKVLRHLEHYRNACEVETSRAALADYYDEAEQEAEMARSVMEGISSLDRVGNLIDFRLCPAARFSGDIIAAEKTPDGILHVMLGDSTGHGLTAAVAGIPALQPFYSMTRAGFGIASIATEMNVKIKEFLSVERYVAAILIAVDEKTGEIECWNGGMPPVLLIKDGRIVQKIHSNHLPLGILPPDAFTPKTKKIHVSDCGYKLVAFTDGVTDGMPLEMDDACLVIAQLSGNLDDIVGGSSHDITSKNDDSAIISVPAGFCPKIQSGAVGENASLRLAGKSLYQVVLHAEQLKHLDVVPMVISQIEQMEPGLNISVFFTALSELFNNALDHGLLKLDSTLKHGEDMERYYAERHARLEALKDGKISIRVAGHQGEGGNFIALEVEDSGSGFDCALIESQGDLARHGRGIKLVRHLCHSLSYENGGRLAIAIIR